MHIKRFVNLLSENMKEKFPEIKQEFYVSKKKNYVHMGLDSPLFLYTRHHQVTEEHRNFLSDELDERFKAMFSQLVNTVKWKFDYIVFQKKTCFKKKVLIFFCSFSNLVI